MHAILLCNNTFTQILQFAIFVGAFSLVKFQRTSEGFREGGPLALGFLESNHQEFIDMSIESFKTVHYGRQFVLARGRHTPQLIRRSEICMWNAD